MTDEEHQFLLAGLYLLTTDLSSRVLACDWANPEEVASADRAMRVLSSYGRNVEKCIAMTATNPSSNDNDTRKIEREDLQEALQRRLVRYAERLGKDELARRLRDRGLDPSAVQLGILGKNKSTSSSDK